MARPGPTVGVTVALAIPSGESLPGLRLAIMMNFILKSRLWQCLCRPGSGGAPAARASTCDSERPAGGRSPAVRVGRPTPQAQARH